MKEIHWEIYQNKIKHYLYFYELKAFISKVILKEDPAQIILFGSLAENNYDYKSDADLFILFDEPCHFKTQKAKLLKYVSLEDNIIDVFPYNITEFNILSQNPDLFMSRAIKRSVLIYNRLNAKI